MRTMKLTLLAASLAIVLTGGPAFGQTAATTGRATTATTATTAPGARTSAAPATTSSAAATDPSNDAAGGGASNPATTTATLADVANNAPRFGPGSTFANDGGNTALGTSAGQTSSGTAAGNSSAGIGTSNPDLGSQVTSADGTVPATFSGPGSTLLVQPSAPQSAAPTVLSTPLLDQAIGRSQAREELRRAQGVEPRVIGIAPRTEADLTHQMPDDPIIRY